MRASPHTAPISASKERLSKLLNLRHLVKILNQSSVDEQVFLFLSFPADDDRFQVMQSLVPVVDRWRHIGTALGLSTATLNTIAAATQTTNPTDALSSMVDKWIAMAYNTDRFAEPSWDVLVKAVAAPAAGENRTVAEDIARKYPEPAAVPVPVVPVVRSMRSNSSPMPRDPDGGLCVCVCVCGERALYL